MNNEPVTNSGYNDHDDLVEKVSYLPKGQQWILRCIVQNPGSVGSSWVGTSPGAREALVKKGLVTHKNPYGDPRHLGSSKYWPTELGISLMGAMAFDVGMAVGYAAWAAEFDRKVDAMHQEARNENARWDIGHGLRYAPNEDIEADVRAVIWKNVVIAK